MAIATLSIDIVAKLASLEAGLSKAAQIAQRQATSIESAFARAGAGLKNFGAGLMGAFSVGVLVQFTRATLDGIDRLNDLSDATGASVANLSALEDVANRTGNTMDSVSDALVKVNKALGDAEPGTAQANAFKALGLTVADLKKMDPVDVLVKVAQSLQGFADDANKARLVQELFGKSLRVVAPLLNDIARAGKLIPTLTDEQAKAVERFNQQLSSLQKNVTDAARIITFDLITALNKLAATLKAMEKAGGFKAFFGSIADEFRANSISVDLERVTNEIVDLKRQQDTWGTDALLDKKVAGLRAEAEQLQRDAAVVSARLKGYAAEVEKQGGQGRRPANEGGGGLRKAKLPDIAPDKTPPKINIPKGPESTEGFLAALRAIEQTDTAKLRTLNDALVELFTLQGEASALGDPTNPDIAKAIEAISQAILDLKPIPPAILDGIERTKSDFLRAEKAGYEDTDKLLRDMAEQAKKTTNIAQELGMTFASAFEDAIVSGRNLSDVLQGLIQDMTRLLVRENITIPLAKLVSGALPNLLGSAKGNVFSGGSMVTAFASGGVVNNPTVFGMSNNRSGLMGEAGPEAVLPLRRGRDGRLGVAGGGGITNVYNIAAGVQRNELQAAMQMTARATEARMMQTLRHRGVV